MDEVETSALLVALSHPLYQGEDLAVVITELCKRFENRTNLENDNNMTSNTNTSIKDVTVYIEVYNGVFSRLASYDKLSNRIIDLLLSLLVNTTCTENNRVLFVNHVISKHQIPFHNSILAFLNYYPQTELKTDDIEWISIDPWQHMASLLCNIASVEKGREILQDQSKGYFKNLSIQIRSKNLVRRKGTIATIRSCLFDSNTHEYMLKEINILPQLSFPLVVAKPFTDEEKVGMDPILWIQANNPNKLPEQDHETLKMLIECLILLCQDSNSREILRKRKIYCICRNLDENIENEEISGLIYEVVNFLVRDET